MDNIVEQIWSSMVGWNVAPDDEAMALTSGRNVVVSHVQITGTWIGSITLYCDDRLARQMAAVLFGACPDRISVEMIDDALGEMINMTGGNFKSLLHEPCNLSLPMKGCPPVACHSDSTATNHGGYGFRCNDKNFLVVVAANHTDQHQLSGYTASS